LKAALAAAEVEAQVYKRQLAGLEQARNAERTHLRQKAAAAVAAAQEVLAATQSCQGELVGSLGAPLQGAAEVAAGHQQMLQRVQQLAQLPQRQQQGEEDEEPGTSFCLGLEQAVDMWGKVGICG
jgi:hypothetical protein